MTIYCTNKLPVHYQTYSSLIVYDLSRIDLRPSVAPMFYRVLYGLNTKGHFTKVYSIKGCEPQNFPQFPWDRPIGFSYKHTVCKQPNPIRGSHGNFKVHTP